MSAKLSERYPSIVQLNMLTGCIPAGIEWMLRYRRILSDQIPLGGLQGLFDICQNNFQVTSQHVSSLLPGIPGVTSAAQFRCEDFPSPSDAQAKFDYVETCLAHNEPCLLSLSRSSTTAHIVPAVEVDKVTVWVLNWCGSPLPSQPTPLSRAVLEEWHRVNGGRDLLVFDPRRLIRDSDTNT